MTKWIVLGVMVLLMFMGGCSAWTSYNGMTTKSESVSAAWAQVENVYQRRADLIPNVVSTVKGYAAHESSTLTAVIEARAKATAVTIKAENLNAENLAKYQQAQDGLSQTLSRLMMVQEQYPNLKADAQFMGLMTELEGTENRIAVERKKFNEVAQEYNTYIRKFPKNMFASLFDFDQRPYFKAEEGANKAPKVKF